MTLPSTIAPALAGALKARGYEELTSVQEAMLTPDNDGRDLLVSAQTGSGKTVAFGIAMAADLLEQGDRLEAPRAPLALIIAPTRELALQVARELEWLYAPTGARITTCVGGMDIRTERRNLERGAHIIVGTPGRLRDHITRRALNMSDLRAVVLDEADEMLDLGFREDLEFILGEAPEDRRTLMFSATVSKSIALLAKRFQKDALRITATASHEKHADITYQAMIVPPHERENAIINTLLYYDNVNTIIFASTREGVKHLASRLSNRGFSVVALSGELSQAERTNALQSMRDGRARVCVATDVAARGIDLPNLDLVIHADLPNNGETLLHRSGRTGRAGRKGTCILVVPFSRRRSAERLLQMTRLDAKSIAAPTINAVQEKVREVILSNERLSDEIPEDMQELMRELQARYTPEQIAAAYLRREIESRPAPEDVSEGPVRALGAPARERGERGERSERAPREDRSSFNGGAWFTLSAGRKHRADPKWILPLICKAGQVSKGDVGAIRILENETRFEINSEKAKEYFATVEEQGTGEKGLVIRTSTAPEQESRGPRSDRGGERRFDKRGGDDKPGWGAPKGKSRFKGGEGKPFGDKPKGPRKPREGGDRKFSR
ncbi:DEAD/DEAH box helicase [Pseudochrobactrum algeriensis]|uniref:DEAD/DEAH box helicase n=1 Tax=Pseudochrobactrum algeriensis TaxID=2834768 RepID=UPI001BCA72C3|nr:DEAD/DEAH box helicase [Pseudochrobactrum algeriensis]MBX8813185.1 DEAD/DEAH box helicase [Ochrobactrum sp. MR34]QVQ36981.1 DEAD/DEAH box helicase [Pseudochrobactrum algeriensis]QVQ40197.1 DEAD/DEAH box helicase [Pseudochrobactrum algeriensis]QVQ44120.1 DEAD/DEAH box helicase [Pseudochrobactrum algeriensis]